MHPLSGCPLKWLRARAGVVLTHVTTHCQGAKTAGWEGETDPVWEVREEAQAVGERGGGLGLSLPLYCAFSLETH